MGYLRSIGKAFLNMRTIRYYWVILLTSVTFFAFGQNNCDKTSVRPLAAFDSVSHLTVSVNMDYPQFPNKILNDSILKWLSSFGVIDKTTQKNPIIANAQSSIENFTKKTRKDYNKDIDSWIAELGNSDHEEVWIFNWSVEHFFTLESESEHFVTYSATTYEYLGGAHPMSYNTFASFNRTDGQLVTWDILDSSKRTDLCALLIQRITDEYFGGESEEMENFSPNDHELPLPTSKPAIIQDSVMFFYDYYEISSAYVSGMPYTQLSFKELRPYMSAWGRKLLLGE